MLVAEAMPRADGETGNGPHCRRRAELFLAAQQASKIATGEKWKKRGAWTKPLL